MFYSVMGIPELYSREALLASWNYTLKPVLVLSIFDTMHLDTESPFVMLGGCLHQCCQFKFGFFYTGWWDH